MRIPSRFTAAQIVANLLEQQPAGVQRKVNEVALRAIYRPQDFVKNR